MGRTMRWIKGFLGINNKERAQKQSPNSGVRQSCLGHSGREPVETDVLCQNPNTIPPNITPAEAAWLRSFYNDSHDKEQSKHAIAVAAATAAAADAAVAAAQAAAAVVRLTSQGRGTMFASGGRERWGATKIQTVFRGYLARKALRALKGLVKLQALVRGYMVRKQAAATFQSMKALIRAQASIRAQRNRGLLKPSSCNFSSPHHHARKSAERIDETSSQQQSSLHSRRLSASFDSINTNIAMGESPKIVEMDTGRPKSRSRRSMVSDSGDDNSSEHHSLSSPCPPYPPPPPRLSILEWQSSIEPEWSLNGDDNRGYTTAQSTPRFATSCGNHMPITPAKSVCMESLFRNYENCPNYMVDTQSFKAKLRSQSAPKHRPEPSGPKRRQSIHEMMGSRNSLSGVTMQRSCSHAQETINFKNAVISKLGRSTEFTREQCREYYMQ